MLREPNVSADGGLAGAAIRNKWDLDDDIL
jgi:hypothetical protein